MAFSCNIYIQIMKNKDASIFVVSEFANNHISWERLEVYEVFSKVDLINSFFCLGMVLQSAPLTKYVNQPFNRKCLSQWCTRPGLLSTVVKSSCLSACMIFRGHCVKLRLETVHARGAKPLYTRGFLKTLMENWSTSYLPSYFQTVFML